MLDKDIDVMEHLSELRRRIIVIISAVTILTIIVYQKILIVINIMSKPLEGYNLKLVYFTLTEGFITRMKVGLFLSIIVLSPLIIYEVIMFINPGLRKRERVILYKSLAYITIFFIAGVVIGYSKLLPYSLNFLIGYSTSYLEPILSGSLYFSFIALFSISIGITFVIPLMFLILTSRGLVTVKTLRKWRKYVISILIFIEVCFIPSVDIMIFLVIILPIVVLYEINIWIFYFKEKIRKKREGS